MMALTKSSFVGLLCGLNPQWEIKMKTFDFIYSNVKIKHLDSKSLEDFNHEHEISLY